STPFRAKVFANRRHDGCQEFVAKRCVFGAAKVSPTAIRGKNRRAGSAAASERRCALGRGLRVLRWLGTQDGANYKVERGAVSGLKNWPRFESPWQVQAVVQALATVATTSMLAR